MPVARVLPRDEDGLALEVGVPAPDLVIIIRVSDNKGGHEGEEGSGDVNTNTNGKDERIRGKTKTHADGAVVVAVPAPASDVAAPGGALQDPFATRKIV